MPTPTLPKVTRSPLTNALGVAPISHVVLAIEPFHWLPGAIPFQVRLCGPPATMARSPVSYSGKPDPMLMGQVPKTVWVAPVELLIRRTLLENVGLPMKAPMYHSLAVRQFTTMP